MITTTTGYVEKSISQQRRPTFEVAVDWSDGLIFEDESDVTISIEIERNQNEPFGGITLTQADLTFINHDNQFTPVE